MDGILRSDRIVLAQAITLIESSRESDRQLAERIVEDCLPHSGNSIRVGITGVTGKRSLSWQSTPVARSPAEAFSATRPA